MGLRAWLGFCEHQWAVTDTQIERNRVYVGGATKQSIGRVCQCKHCGELRTFWIGASR